MPNESNVIGKLGMPAERVVLRQSPEGPAPATKILRASSEDIHIGENTTFEGNFETRGTIFVDGQLTKARVQASQLSIGPHGVFDGDVTAARAEIGGSFTGRMTVTTELVLRSTARIEGEISCGELISHRGAAIRAQVATHTADGSAASASPALPALGDRRRPTARGAALAVAFGLGALMAIGAVGTFLLFHLAPMVLP